MSEHFYPLQSVILPDPTLCSETRLYYKVTNGLVVSEETALRVADTSTVSFDTWFGGFSIGKWQRLSTCESFVLKLSLEGKGLITLYRQRRYKGRFYSQVLQERPYDTTSAETFFLPLPHEIKQGDRLFFVLSTEQSTRLHRAQWGTYTPPARSVYLGLVITTFNRQEAVIASAQRLSQFIQQVDQSADSSFRVALAIVDNGRNLSLPPLPGVQVIPNPNLGGAGGFARGLYHFKHENPATHCLFMDDDAACEPESIWRTLQLLAYAKEDRLAIAGAMLRDAPAYLLHEKGARFRYHCMPLQHNRDLRLSKVLADVELPTPFDYGGWWFFAFPLHHVTHYPFPFFVRGDDVQFGLAHRFNLETLNGVSVWGDDFTAKEGPVSKYLDMRHHLMQHLLTERLPSGAVILTAMVWWQWLRPGLRFHYAIEEAQLMALEDVLKGPDFWARNADMHETFPRLRPLIEESAPQPIEDISAFSIAYPPIPRSRLRIWGARLIKLITLNGHLLPPFLLQKQPVVVEKGDARLEMFTWKLSVFQLEPDGRQGIWLKRDYRRFFRLMGRLSKLTLQMIIKRRALIRAYRQAYPHLTSEAFWQSWFEQQKLKGAAGE